LHDESLQKILPTYVYLYFGFCLFMLQTFDAIDGKHARNTEKASCLGQLLDHGMDSFSNSFILGFMCQGQMSGNTFITVIYQLVCHVTIY